MEAVFLKVLNLGLAANYLVTAVILLRLLFRKAPKWAHCLLWAMVGLRLILPFSFESDVSLLPSAEPIPADIAVADVPHIDSGFSAVDRAVNPVLADMAAADNNDTEMPASATDDSATPAPISAPRAATPLARVLNAVVIVWLSGTALILVYGFVSYFRLRRQVAASLHISDRVYLCDHLGTSFILGLFRPRVYLRSDLSEQEMQYVIAHEKAHLARHDHVWKPLGFLLLAIYWFHPLLWLAYALLCRDIEGACDEKVIAEMDGADKKGYATALAAAGAHRKSIMACPLAFGEVGVKDRIKAILNYKKPAFWIILAALVAGAAAAVVFLTVPKKGEPQVTAVYHATYHAETAAELQETYPEYFGLDASQGLTVYVWQMAKYNYCCHLVSGAPEAQQLPLLNLNSTSVADMRVILATYDLKREKITIVPYQHPLSSYITGWEFYGQSDDEDARQRGMAAFRGYLDALLLGELYDDDYPKYEIMTFDIDGDGQMEICSLGYGRTSGIFTFSISAREIGKNVNEYYTTFHTEHYIDLRFWYLQNDTFCVKATPPGGTATPHYFEISVANGNIVLSENGVPISAIP